MYNKCITPLLLWCCWCYLKQQTQFYGGKQSKAEVCRVEPTNNFKLSKHHHHHQTHGRLEEPMKSRVLVIMKGGRESSSIQLKKYIQTCNKYSSQFNMNHEIGRWSWSLQICTWVQSLFARECVSSCPHWHKLD